MKSNSLCQGSQHSKLISHVKGRQDVYLKAYLSGQVISRIEYRIHLALHYKSLRLCFGPIITSIPLQGIIYWSTTFSLSARPDVFSCLKAVARIEPLIQRCFPYLSSLEVFDPFPPRGSKTQVITVLSLARGRH